MKKETYDVTGMSCAACSSRVEKAVAKQPGAQQVAVNLLKNSMVVEYDESQLSSAQIIAAVEKGGLRCVSACKARQRARREGR
ncbi:MAG: heavy-metal-associated domain-containing protein [Oscillibacter sp.]